MSKQLVVLNKCIDQLAIEYPDKDAMDLLIMARKEVNTNVTSEVKENE